MKNRLTAGGMLVAGLIAGLVLPATTAVAAPGDGSGTGAVRVAVAAPDGIPANVELAGKTRLVAAKAPAGTSALVTLSMPIGAYHVNLPSVTFDGTRYIGQASRPEVVVRAGETADLSVTYVAEEGARALRATAVGRTSVALSWTAAAGSRFSLRRTVGDVPAAHRSQGVEVATSGTTAVDQGLDPGTRYSYALFTQNNSRWFGPLVVVAGTAPVAGSAQATYIAAPTTLLARPADITAATPTGSGVQVVLGSSVSTPLLGAAVVLPISSALAGGFLGVVTNISSDGRTIDLTAGGLSDAFDYYQLAVDDLASSAVPAQTGTAAPPAPNGPAGGFTTAALSADCKGSVSETITFSPDLALGGHFTTVVDKYRFLGQNIPVGASVDMAVKVTVTGAAKVKVSAGVKCSIELAKKTVPITVSPVPIAAVFQATAEFTVSGVIEADNVGLTATAGVRVAGTMSVTNGTSFNGQRIMEVNPLTPTITTPGLLEFKVGGDVVVGPGAGTEGAGVVAGLGGELRPVNASVGPHFPVGDPRYTKCAVVKAGATLALSLTLKAWLGKWRLSEKVTLDALDWSLPYPGSPWYLPTGCQNLPGAEPQDSLLGPGVTKVDDAVVGGSDQWGHLDGFVPGKKTWVLSTGSIADAVGTPGTFASTNLGRDGDAGLTALAGNPTYDAAAYQVTLVPTADTLHIRYVFASEEYPEYVGSRFNDVMAVRVNGTNCATVPGGTDAVSV